ncbi:MAG TPA: 50S ribosomal protein L21 [Victivallales bacterium]|nr:50S ribosomal protein L21 [Victivallales bacterium]
MYAVIATGGKQYRVQPDEIINVELLGKEVGETVKFDVLAVGEGKDVKLGTPTVEGANVEGEVIDNFRDKKVIAFKMKKRKGYRRKKGHRQYLTKIKISKIEA